MKIERVLIISRPRLRAFYEYVGENLFQNSKLYYLSENRGTSDIDIMELFYGYLSGGKSGNESLFTSCEIEDIRVRDRFLRSLPELKAVELIRAMASAADETLNSIRPQLIFTIMTDNYILDIFRRLHTRNHGVYLGTVVSMIDEYARLTSRGELIKVRSVEDDEVSRVYERLTERYYRPQILNESWVVSGTKQMLRSYVREKVKNIVFPIIKRIKRDPYNFHYNCIKGVGATAHKFSMLFGNYFYDAHWKQKAEQYAAKKVVLIPLQFNPESSIDYMCDTVTHIDHNKILLQLLEKIPNDYLIIVKEHPAMVGKQDIAFYKKILGYKNTLLVSPYEHIREVLEYTAHVVTWSGSTGFEARLLGKHVMCLQKPYYDFDGYFDLIDDVNLMPEFLEKDVSNSKEAGFELVRNLLEGSMPGSVKFIDFNKANEVSKRSVDTLIQNIRDNLTVAIENSLIGTPNEVA